MKLFVVALLVAVASAQPLFPIIPTAYHTAAAAAYSPYVSHVINPAVSPLYYNLKPQVRPQYEEDPAKKVAAAAAAEPKKLSEEALKPEVYATPYGLQPVVPVKYDVEVPARFVQKNGEIEKTTYVKREAEADPALLYGTAGVVPSVYSSGLFPSIYSAAYTTPLATAAYAAPLAHAVSPALTYAAVPAVAPAVTKPVADVKFTKPVVDKVAKTIANDQVTPYLYDGKGTYAAVNEGAEHYAKREAEADPAIVYSAGYYPSVYRTAYASPFVSRAVYTAPAYTSLGYRSIYSGLYY